MAQQQPYTFITVRRNPLQNVEDIRRHKVSASAVHAARNIRKIFEVRTIGATKDAIQIAGRQLSDQLPRLAGLSDEHRQREIANLLLRIFGPAPDAHVDYPPLSDYNLAVVVDISTSIQRVVPFIDRAATMRSRVQRHETDEREVLTFLIELCNALHCLPAYSHLG